MPRAIAARVAYVPGTGFYADGTGQRQHAAQLLVPAAGAHPRGRAPAGRRDGAGDGDARGLRRRPALDADRRRGPAGADAPGPDLA